MRRNVAPPRPPWPWDPVQLELHELSAIKAIPAETFSIIEKLCGVGRNPFTAGGEDGRRATDFGAGKLWVGHTLRGIREMRMPSFKPKEEIGPHTVPTGTPPE